MQKIEKIENNDRVVMPNMTRQRSPVFSLRIFHVETVVGNV